jgi:hypothetical protein
LILGHAGGVGWRDTRAALRILEERLWTVRLARFHIPLALIRRVVAAAELQSRALHWPAYLDEAAPDDVAAMLHRIQHLAACLGIAV